MVVLPPTESAASLPTSGDDRQLAVVFADLLGFRHFCLTDPSGALAMLGDYQSLFYDTLQETRRTARDGSTHPGLADHELGHGISSFDAFLPFTDCFFVFSSDVNVLIRQLAHRFIEAFLFKGHAFVSAEDSARPEEQHIHDLPRMQRRAENWFPVLFRCGLSYGPVRQVPLFRLDAMEVGFNRAPFGQAAVRAVALEPKGAGPQWICDDHFVEQLSAQSRAFVMPADAGFEILWPSFTMLNETNEYGVIGEYGKLADPALALWRANARRDVGRHYWAWLRLIVRSTLWTLIRQHNGRGIDHVRRLLHDRGLRIVDVPQWDLAAQ
jgi:hypothetical protein